MSENLQKLQNDVQKLRDKVGAQNAAAEQAARDLDAQLAETQLLAEKTRLEAELATATERTKSYSPKSGVSVPLSAAREAMRLAEAQKQAGEELRAADAKSRGGNKSEVEERNVSEAIANQASTDGAPDTVKGA